MDQIKFRPGQMIAFLSTKSFALGNTGYTIAEGMEVLFDGTNVEVGGHKFVLPTLRGALKLGWLVLPEQYDEAMDNPMAAPTANIQVRSANDLGSNPMQPAKKTAITTIESDERVVMSRGQRAQAATQQTQQVRAQQGRAGGGVARSFSGGGGLDVGGAEFGVPVARTLLTPARHETKVTPDTVGQAIIAAEKVKVQPGEGLSESEMLARMSEEERADYLAAKEARKGDVMSRTVGYVPPPAQTTNLAAYNQMGGGGGGRTASAQPTRQQPQRAVQAQQAAPSRVVAQVQGSRTVQTEGASVALSVGGGTEIADMSGMTGQVHESVVEAEGMTFRNTNGPKKAFPNMQQTSPAPQQAAPVPQQQPAFVDDGTQSRIEKDGTADARKQIAKAICKDFPDEYSFSDHWKRRLAMIRLNYEGRTDVIRAIFAAESDDFKKLIMEEFPEAFASN